MKNIVFREESYQIIGACFEVYKEQGCGFTEAVYQECLAYELEVRQIPFVSQPKIELAYKRHVLNQFFRPDFICFDKIIVELKALSHLSQADESQALNYLNASRLELALLVNFGHFPKVEYKRIANTRLGGAKSPGLSGQISDWLKANEK